MKTKALDVSVAKNMDGVQNKFKSGIERTYNYFIRNY